MFIYCVCHTTGPSEPDFGVIIRKIDFIGKEHLTESVENNMKIEFKLLEKDCVRIRNLLEKEIKIGHKLVTNNFTSVNLTAFAEQIGTCISSLNKLHDELDVVHRKLSLAIQGTDETIIYEKQMENDFVLLNLALKLKFTLDFLERLVLSRGSQLKGPTLCSNDFEKIQKAVNRRGPLQVDDILTSYKITAKELEIQQSEHISEDDKLQNSLTNEVSDIFQANRKIMKVQNDLSEATVGSKVKSSIDKTGIKGQTNQQSNEKRQRCKKKKKVSKLSEGLSSRRKGSKYCGKKVKHSRRRKQFEVKNGKPPKKRHANSTKEKNRRQRRHIWIKAEKYMNSKGTNASWENSCCKHDFNWWRQLYAVKTRMDRKNENTDNLQYKPKKKRKKKKLRMLHE